MRNDALGAPAALQKGSFSSTFFQQYAMRSCRLERRVGCETLHLHAHGRVLIKEGVDNMSRALAYDGLPNQQPPPPPDGSTAAPVLLGPHGGRVRL